MKDSGNLEERVSWSVLAWQQIRAGSLGINPFLQHTFNYRLYTIAYIFFYLS